MATHERSVKTPPASSMNRPQRRAVPTGSRWGRSSPRRARWRPASSRSSRPGAAHRPAGLSTRPTAAGNRPGLGRQHRRLIQSARCSTPARAARSRSTPRRASAHQLINHRVIHTPASTSSPSATATMVPTAARRDEGLGAVDGVQEPAPLGVGPRAPQLLSHDAVQGEALGDPPRATRSASRSASSPGSRRPSSPP